MHLPNSQMTTMNSFISIDMLSCLRIPRMCARLSRWLTWCLQKILDKKGVRNPMTCLNWQFQDNKRLRRKSDFLSTWTCIREGQSSAITLAQDNSLAPFVLKQQGSPKGRNSSSSSCTLIIDKALLAYNEWGVPLVIRSLSSSISQPLGS